MNNLTIKKRITRIIATGLTVILLSTGCSSKENDAEPITNDTTTTMEDNSTNNQDVRTDENENTTSEEFDCFASETEEVNNIIYTEGIEKASEVWREYFIDAVDFIFYDKEYKDTKFSELNPEAQEKTLETIKEMGNTMTELNPNWQEDIDSIKGIATSTYYNILANFKDLVGEDIYNDLKGIKDSIKNGAIDIGNIIKDNTKEWYENYKNKTK